MPIIKRLIKIGQGLLWAVMLAFLVLIGISFLPFEQGLKIFTVQSGSMEPSIKTGSVIFVWPSKSYEVGDIVTRQNESSTITVTHRIIENNGTEFITKGDANNVADPQPLVPSAIVGQLMFKIPYLGYPIAFARTAKGLLLLIIIPSLFIIFDEVLNITRELKTIRKKKAGYQFYPNPMADIKYLKMNTPVRIYRIDTRGIPKEIRHLIS